MIATNNGAVACHGICQYGAELTSFLAGTVPKICACRVERDEKL
jgi:hypothetical protein